MPCIPVLLAAVSGVSLLAASLLGSIAVTLSPAQAQHQHQQQQQHAAPAAAHSPEIRHGALVLGAPWARATPPAAQVGGGYLSIRNTGAAPDRLVSFASPVAGRGEVHEMAVTDGVMRMREIKGGLEIKPGETVELKPGGLHVMFMELKEPLKEGARVKGTLTFEKAGPIDVEFAVRAIAAGAGQPAH
jgi:hypothetical protein